MSDVRQPGGGDSGRHALVDPGVRCCRPAACASPPWSTRFRGVRIPQKFEFGGSYQLSSKTGHDFLLHDRGWRFHPPPLCKRGKRRKPGNPNIISGLSVSIFDGNAGNGNAKLLILRAFPFPSPWKRAISNRAGNGGNRMRRHPRAIPFRNSPRPLANDPVGTSSHFGVVPPARHLTIRWLSIAR